MHGPGNYLEECKVLQDYSEKHAVKQPHKESLSECKEKRGKLVKFNENTKEMNNMAKTTAPKKREKRSRIPNSESKNVTSEDDGCTYGIDRLNIQAEYDLDSHSK